jgi:hypothetical protein
VDAFADFEEERGVPEDDSPTGSPNRTGETIIGGPVDEPPTVVAIPDRSGLSR